MFKMISLATLATLTFSGVFYLIIQASSLQARNETTIRFVASSLEEAKAQMAEKNWNQAVDSLQSALNRDRSGIVSVVLDDAVTEARSLLPKALKEKANQSSEKLFDIALADLSARRFDEARSGLLNYISKPTGTRLDRAKHLLHGINLAASDDASIEFLTQIPDYDFYRLESGGTPYALGAIDVNELTSACLERLLKNSEKVKGKRDADRRRRIEMERLAAEKKARDEADFIARRPKYILFKKWIDEQQYDQNHAHGLFRSWFSGFTSNLNQLSDTRSERYQFKNYLRELDNKCYPLFLGFYESALKEVYTVDDYHLEAKQDKVELKMEESKNYLIKRFAEMLGDSFP